MATTRRRHFGLSNLLKKKSRRSDRDFEVFVSVRRKKRRQDSELKLQAVVTGAEFVWTYCTKATPPSRLIVICEKLVSRTNLAGTQTH